MLKHIARRLSRGQEGFTLIELLVVVAIIALLATFAAPKLFEAINKSKKAPGQADMNTISSALERYYMDNNAYPTTQAQITNGYLKASTTFVNGFKQSYLYGTSAGGAGYVLVDVQGDTTDANATAAGQQVTVTCGGTTYEFTVSNSTLTVLTTLAANTNFSACTVPAGMKVMSN